MNGENMSEEARLTFQTIKSSSQVLTYRELKERSGLSDESLQKGLEELDKELKDSGENLEKPHNSEVSTPDKNQQNQQNQQHTPESVDPDVEREIERLDNKLEGVMDRLNAVLGIKESGGDINGVSASSSAENTDDIEQGEGLSNNAKTVLSELQEMDEVSVDKLEERTGMSRDEIKEAYKELKSAGKL